jgi:hypothetical protein
VAFQPDVLGAGSLAPDHNGTDWAWHEGRWEKPPAPKVTWVAPQYRKDHGKTRYEPEHWSNQHLVDEH